MMGLSDIVGMAGFALLTLGLGGYDWRLAATAAGAMLLAFGLVSVAIRR